MQNSRRILVCGPDGHGGVASAIAAVMPELPEARRSRIGRAPGELLGGRAFGAAVGAMSGTEVVHLHPSLRSRAMTRDLALVAVARRLGLGVVFHLHGMDERWAVHLDRSAASARLLRTALDGVIVACAAASHVERLAGWGLAAEHVPNALDPALLPDVRRPVPGRILLLGRLAPGKGAEQAVRVATQCRLALVVAGDGPLRAKLAALAGPSVVFEGWVGPERRRELLATAALLVHPSGAEAAPLAVAEAVASGVPVVARRTGDVDLLVGGSGTVLDAPSDAELGDALVRVLADPPSTDAQAAALRARCGPSAVAERWRDLHRRAILARGGR